ARSLVRHAEVESLKIFEECSFEFAREIAQGHFGFFDPLDDFVIHVSDVHHLSDLISFELKITPDEIAENEGAPVPNVRKIINSWRTAVQAALFSGGIQRDELLDRPRQRVAELQRHSQTRRSLTADFGKERPKDGGSIKHQRSTLRKASSIKQSTFRSTRSGL